MVKVYELRSFNQDLRNSTTLAFDKHFFDDGSGRETEEMLPKKNEVVAVTVFRVDTKGQPLKRKNGSWIFKEKISFKVEEDWKWDNRPEEQILNNPRVPTQTRFGRPGNMVHRAYCRKVSLHVPEKENIGIYQWL